MTLLLLALACTGGPDPSGDTGDAPSIRIVSPLDDATVCNAPVVIQVEVENFVLVDPFDGGEEPGTGHIDLAINGQEAAETMYGGEELTVPFLDPGFLYQLKVELSNADHTPVEPYAGDFVYVTASEDAC